MWFCSVTKCPSSVIIITLSYMHAATWCRWEYNKHVNARKSLLDSVTVSEFQNANHSNANHSMSVGRISKATSGHSHDRVAVHKVHGPSCTKTTWLHCGAKNPCQARELDFDWPWILVIKGWIEIVQSINAWNVRILTLAASEPRKLYTANPSNVYPGSHTTHL